MFQENEIVMLLLGVGCLFFTVINHARLTRLAEWKLLAGGFYLVLVSWVMTVVEGLFWGELFNFLEHMCYAASSIMVAAWFWKVSAKDRKPHA